jgi:hypothetical protein
MLAFIDDHDELDSVKAEFLEWSDHIVDAAILYLSQSDRVLVAPVYRHSFAFQRRTGMECNSCSRT